MVVALMQAKHCNIWRMYNDIPDSYDSMSGIVDWSVPLPPLIVLRRRNGAQVRFRVLLVHTHTHT